MIDTHVMAINLVQLPQGSIPAVGSGLSMYAARQSLNNARRTGGVVVGMLQSARRVQSQMASVTKPRPVRLDVYA